MEPSPSHTFYISGPMTGYENYNYAAFDRAEKMLTANGHSVLNPAKMDAEQGIEGLSYHDLLKRDMKAIVDHATAVALLPGWQNSRGATKEAFFAQQIGLPIFELLTGDQVMDDPEAIRWNVTEPRPIPYTGSVRDDKGNRVMPENVGKDYQHVMDGGFYILRPVESITVPYEAQEIVLGARRYTYGHPLDNFLRIAELWTATFGHKLIDGQKIDVRDVTMAMIQVKIAREYNSPKRDNVVDVLGYGYAYRESIEEAERRGVDLGDLIAPEVRKVQDNSVAGFERTAK